MSDLGNRDIFAKNLKYYMDKNNIGRAELCAALGFKYTTVSEWLAGNKYPRIDKIEMLANYFEIQKSDLIEDQSSLLQPTTAEDTVTFPVIGEIAAGYDHIALEDWTGDTVEVPISYLKGRKTSEFFVLRVKGDSMYPLYQDNDIVLVLKQNTLSYSGQVGAVLYNDDYATLKKVEYVYGEDWMRLIPINPAHPPKTIKGSDLEHCKVIGIPKMLIREIETV